MRLLFVSSEAYPLAKTGGLADVAGALPAALADLGVDVRVLLPAYPSARRALAEVVEERAVLGDPFGSGVARLLEGRLADSPVPVWLLDCPALYDRDGGPYQDAAGADWPDNDLRFGLLGWAAARLGHTSSPLPWRPAVLHANDWQASLAPAYLHAWGGARPATVLTIHNMAYQGLFPAETLLRLGLPWSMYGIDGLEFWGRMSFLKAGIFYSDRLTTVSPTYAREIQTAEYGCGLDGLLRVRREHLFGILNGVDYGVWDPARDACLAHRHAAHDLDAKPMNKHALQCELGLSADAAAPLMIVVSRLNEHKGTDLILAQIPFLTAAGAQLAVLGTGDRELEEGFRQAARRHPGQVAVNIGYSEDLAHRMQAGADMLLMPSRSEPCGLTQFYAFRYGTVPVVHRTGGLADSVTDVTYETLLAGSATGFMFGTPTASAFQWALERALGMFAQPEQWRRIRAAGVAQDFSWRSSALRYLDLYHAMLAADAVTRPFPAPNL